MIGIKYDKLPFIGKEGIGGGGKAHKRKQISLSNVGSSQQFKDTSLKLDFPEELYKKPKDLDQVEYKFEEPPLVQKESKTSGIFNRRTFISPNKSIYDEVKPGRNQSFDLRSSLIASDSNRHSAPELQSLTEKTIATLHNDS